MENFYFNEKTRMGTLFLNNDLTIQNILTIKDTFSQALEKCDHLSLNHNNANEFDFSYVQLLLALIRTCRQQNKIFSLENGSPKEFIELIKLSGFENEEQIFNELLMEQENNA